MIPGLLSVILAPEAPCARAHGRCANLGWHVQQAAEVFLECQATAHRLLKKHFGCFLLDEVDAVQQQYTQTGSPPAL